MRITTKLIQNYKIYRYYADDRPPKLIRSGLTLAEAQAHCNDPETSARTAKQGRGKCRCSWFDGYESEQ